MVSTTAGSVKSESSAVTVNYSCVLFQTAGLFPWIVTTLHQATSGATHRCATYDKKKKKKMKYFFFVKENKLLNRKGKIEAERR